MYIPCSIRSAHNALVSDIYGYYYMPSNSSSSSSCSSVIRPSDPPSLLRSIRPDCPSLPSSSSSISNPQQLLGDPIYNPLQAEGSKLFGVLVGEKLCLIYIPKHSKYTGKEFVCKVNNREFNVNEIHCYINFN